MANISSYNQLSSWNEDDDLLFVQQPDAPKKAHPSQMKEYILEGLDVASVGGAGRYISEISEADGKISATAETMDAVPTEGSSKAVTSGGIKTAIDDSVSLKTATGNPITLTDAANADAEELLMTIEPIQSGSGDPSPTNVRPISGLTSGEVQTTNGTDTNTATITFGQTVYGGSVNFKTGEVTVTHGFDISNTSNGWDIISGYSGLFGKLITDKAPRVAYTGEDIGKSNIGVVRFAASNAQANNYPIAVQRASANGYLTYKNENLSTLSDLNTFFENTPLQVCYELATPVTLTLTPAELELLKGNNTITANGAEISIEYYPDNAIGALAGRVDDKADITYVDNAINNQVDSKHYKLYSQDFTNVDISAAWGGWYITTGSVLSISYSDLGLTEPPAAVFLSVETQNNAFMIMQTEFTESAVNFHLVRPNSVTGVSVTINALVVY